MFSPTFSPVNPSSEVSTMPYVIAIVVSLVCLSLAWGFSRPTSGSPLEQANRTTPTLIADSPPPEDQGTPGRRS